MMSRKELDDVLMDYLFDELSPEEVLRFESSVANHPELLQEISDHRRTLEITSTLPEPTMPQGLLDEAVRSAAAHVAPQASHERSLLERLFEWMAQPVAIAAGLLMAVGSLSLFVDFTESNEAKPGFVSDGPAISAAARDDRETPMSASAEAARLEPLSSSPTPELAAASDVSEEQVASALEIERQVRELTVREVSPGVVSRLRQLPQEEVVELADTNAIAEQHRPKVSRAHSDGAKADISSKAWVEPVKIAAASPAQGRVEAPALEAASRRALRSLNGKKGASKGAVDRPRSRPQAVPEQASKEALEKSPARLLRTFKRLVAQGKLKDARRVLDTLATLPGQDDVVRQGRRTLKASSKARATRKVKSQGGKPSKKGK